MTDYQLTLGNELKQEIDYLRNEISNIDMLISEVKNLEFGDCVKFKISLHTHQIKYEDLLQLYSIIRERHVHALKKVEKQFKDI